MGKTFQEMNSVIDTVLADNCIKEPPVLAKELAENTGLNVVCVKFNEIDPKYSNISGFIDIDSCNMYVNALENPKRMNFTIAHELGHYLLGHTSKAEYGELLFRRPLSNEDDPVIEKEANYFAANLLVPKDFLRKTIKNYPFITDYQLGNIFGVSDSVIRYRRQNVGV